MVTEAGNPDNVLANLRRATKEDEEPDMTIRRSVLAAAAILLLTPQAALAAKRTKGATATTTTSSSTTTAATAEAVAPAPVTDAILDIAVTTTSDWTQVAVAPGRFASGTVTSSSGATTAKVGGSIVTVKGTLGATKTATFRVLYDETTLADPISISVLKGTGGITSATVTNVSASPFEVAAISDKLHGSGSNAVTTSVARSAALGTVQPRLPHADSRRLTLAFWYPWWTDQSLASPTLADRPLENRTSWSQADVDGATAQARENGIDGFVVSWAGQAENGTQFDLALNAATSTNGYVAPLVEMPQAAPDGGTPDPAVVTQWITEALSRSASPGFLRADGLPVVFVYGMDSMTLTAWQQVVSQLTAAGTPVRLVGDSGTQDGRALSWGTYRYSTFAPDANLQTWDHDRMIEARADAAVGGGPSHLFAATVMPGFDDRNLRGADRPVLDRAGGATYDHQWDLATAADPDWVLITSWNEWYEATSVQPSVAYGDLALRQTATRSAAFRAG